MSLLGDGQDGAGGVRLHGRGPDHLLQTHCGQQGGRGRHLSYVSKNTFLYHTKKHLCCLRQSAIPASDTPEFTTFGNSKFALFFFRTFRYSAFNPLVTKRYIYAAYI